MNHPLVTAARAYLGVPFRHQGRGPKSLDCAGLLLRAYADLGVVLPDLRAYGREPHRDGLMQAVIAALGAPVTDGPREGDVCVFAYVVEPHHVGLVTTLAYGGLGLIHADGAPSVSKVVEHRLDATWLDRIVSVHRRAV